MPKKKKALDISINLVPKDPFFESPLGKILKWALTVGRYIVIFTELVVIISFVTRFSLDRRVTDLNDAIFQQKTIIESYGNLESEIKAFQAKIQAYNQLEQKQNYSEVFADMGLLTPTGIRLDEMEISHGEIFLVGGAVSQNAFTLFMNNLQLYPKFTQVSIESIEGNKDQEDVLPLVFEVIIERKQE